MKILSKIFGGLFYMGLFIATIYFEWMYLTSPGLGFHDPKHHGYTGLGAVVIVLPLAAITLIAWVCGRHNAESAPTAPARTYSRIW